MYLEKKEIRRYEREEMKAMPMSIPRLKVNPPSPFSAPLAMLEMVLGPGVMATVTR